MSLKAGFDPQEARDMINLAFMADMPIMGASPKEKTPALNLKAAATDSPLVNQKYLPSFYANRWPPGWVAAIDNKQKNWESSFLQSGKPFVNRALIAKKEGTNVYCLAFQGTSSLYNVLEDFLAIPVTAGRIKADDISCLPIPDAVKGALKTILLFLPKHSYVTSRFPTDPRARIHLGFRLAFESFNYNSVKPQSPEKGENSVATHNKVLSVFGPPKFKTLTQTLSSLEGEEIDLMITGHSLGGALAGVATAWLSTQPIQGKTFNIKSYPMAQPKPGNEYLANSVGLLLGPGRAMTLNNSLDTVAQVPLTLQLPRDLNDFESIGALLEGVTVPEWLGKLGITKEQFEQAINQLFVAAKSLSLGGDFTFTHIGERIPLNGKAISEDNIYVFPHDRLPKFLFPTPPAVPDANAIAAKPWDVNILTDMDLDLDKRFLGAARSLWHHAPWVYQQLIHELANPHHADD